MANPPYRQNPDQEPREADVHKEKGTRPLSSRAPRESRRELQSDRLEVPIRKRRVVDAVGHPLPEPQPELVAAVRRQVARSERQPVRRRDARVDPARPPWEVRALR